MAKSTTTQGIADKVIQIVQTSDTWKVPSKTGWKVSVPMGIGSLIVSVALPPKQQGKKHCTMLKVQDNAAAKGIYARDMTALEQRLASWEIADSTGRVKKFREVVVSQRDNLEECFTAAARLSPEAPVQTVTVVQVA